MNVRKRTILVMGRVLDQMDGLGVYSTTLLQHMLQKDPSSRYIILLRTDEHASLFAQHKNAEVRVIPSRSKLWWDQVIVPREARRADADIIFNPKFSIPLVARRPCVFVLHGSDWFVNPRNYKWWDNLYIRLLFPIYCRKARRLLSISQTVINDMVRFTNLAPRKATVTYAAAGARFVPIADKTSLRTFAERYKLPDKYILTVGRVYHTSHDNLDEYPGGNNESLVRGYRRYREYGGSLPLVVVGRDIDKYLRRRGFTDADLDGIHFTGFIPNTEIVKAYNLAKLFVLATLYESFALPLIEAMASGCPALVPSTGACPEVGGNAARYVDPLDVEAIGKAMLEIAHSDNLRAQMRDAGLKRARQFSWDQTADKTLQAFDDIVPAHPGADKPSLAATQRAPEGDTTGITY